MRGTGADDPGIGRRWAAAIPLAALAIRLLFCFLVYPRIGTRLNWKGIDDGFDELAANLVLGHGFTFHPSLPPNLTTPPGYAFFLAFVYRLTGIVPNEGWRIWVSHSLLDTGTTLLVMVIALRLFRSRRAAIIAGALYAVYPQTIVYCARPYAEVLATFVLALAVTVALEAESGAAWLPALVSGLLFGLAALVKEKILLFPAVLAAALLWRWRRDPRRGAPAAALVLAGTVIAVSPWIARDYHLTGQLMPITSRSGRALHWGLRSDYSLADPDVEHVPRPGTPDTIRWGMVPAPRPDDPNMSEARRRLEGDQALLQIALHVVRERPGYVLKMIPVKLLAFWYWGQPRVIWVNFIMQIPLLLLGVWGVILARERERLLVPVLLVIYFAGVHSLLVARMRYSLLVMPYVIMLAGYTLTRMTEKRVRPGGPRAAAAP